MHYIMKESIKRCFLFFVQKIIVSLYISDLDFFEIVTEQILVCQNILLGVRD